MIYEFGEPSTLNEKPVRFCRIKNIPCSTDSYCGCTECVTFKKNAVGWVERANGHQCVSAHTQSKVLPGLQTISHWYDMYCQSEREKANLAAEVLSLRKQLYEVTLQNLPASNESYVDW